MRLSFFARIALVLLVGFGVATLAHAFPLQNKVPVKRIKMLIQTLKSWKLTCNEFSGELKQVRIFAGLPGKAKTTVSFYITRHLAHKLPGTCKKQPLRCRQCDQCSQACVQGKPWHLMIEKVHLKSIVLAHAHSIAGFPFKAGTKLLFRKNGVLAAATLHYTHQLSNRKLKRIVSLPKGAKINFIPAPNPKIWRLPKMKIFKIGNFRCYYTGQQLAMVCTF